MNATSFLIGHSIELRVPSDSDVMESGWSSWYNDPNTTRYNSHGVFPITPKKELEVVHGIMENPRHILLAIFDKKNKKLIGNAALQNIDLINRHCNIAITIGEEAPISAGVEVYGLLANHAFMRLNLHRIEDSCHEKLKTFADMLGVLGFKVEGVGKDYFLRNGIWSDKIYFSLLAEDFKALQKERGGLILFKNYNELLNEIKSKINPI